MTLSNVHATSEEASEPDAQAIELTSVESELLRQFQQGGSSALATYFAELRHELHQMLRYRIDQRLKRRLDASDIIQEAYLESCRRLPVYLANPQMPPSAWVRRLVRQSLCQTQREHLDAKCRDLRREFHTDEVVTTVNVSELSASLTPPEARLQQAEVRTKLIEILSAMPDLEREILTLIHFESRSHREAAAELNISIEAAKKRYRRAIIRLKGWVTSESKIG